MKGGIGSWCEVKNNNKGYEVNLDVSLNQTTKSHAIYGIETIGEVGFRGYWADLHVSVRLTTDNHQNYSFL